MEIVVDRGVDVRQSIAAEALPKVPPEIIGQCRLDIPLGVSVLA